MKIYLIWIFTSKKHSYWEDPCSAIQAFAVENSRFDWCIKHERMLVL